DKNGMLIGEAPCTLDLIRITDHDFRVVNWASIGLIFIIIFFVFKSLSLPVLLVLVIEFAIFINMGIPGFTGTELPFVASVVIGTIQLGSTVDYAILMTSRYQTERAAGNTKEEAVMIAHKTSFTSIIVSAFSFFAATFGVGLYSNISMISSLCLLMARGALISMATVLIVLPSVLLFMDPVIVRTSIGFLPESQKKHNGSKHTADPQPQG
ncbi:MAG: MMPL family transporter, partial [Eubacterium sp.]|nr:MMPL family transporter [Eubacterium sp.]